MHWNRARTARRLAAAAVVAAAAPLAHAAGYVEVFSASEINGGNADLTTVTFAISDGSTVFSHAAKTSTPRDFAIVKNNGGTTTLATLASWTADVGAPSNDRLFTGLGSAVVGNNLQIIDGETDQIYRVDTSTGMVNTYITNADIAAHTGLGSANISNALGGGVNLAGEPVFYDTESDSLLVGSGPGAVTTLLSNSQLVAAQDGDDDVDSGVTFDPAGNLYWGNNNTDTIYKYDGMDISPIVQPDDLSPFVGSITFSSDMFVAPDGLLYFRAGTGGDTALFSFDPAAVDPASTVSVVLSNEDLNDGPAGSAFISNLSWHEGNIGFNVFSGGFYAVPEPGSLALLGLGGLLVARRRR